MYSINITKGTDIISYDLLDKKKKLFKEYKNGKYIKTVKGCDLQGIVSETSFYSSLIYYKA